MLVRDFSRQLNAQSPHLAATLTVGNLVQFATLAAKVQFRAGKSLRLSPTRIPVLQFFQTALPAQPASHLLGDLRRICFPFLNTCRVSPTDLIRKFGLEPSLPNKGKLAERYLRSPLSTCIVCSSPNHQYTLHVHSRINGYLHNIDGVHPVEMVIMNCSNALCDTVYRPSYYSQGGKRYYYTQAMNWDNDYLHVHCHYYIGRRLAYMFRVLQMLAHVSHFNLVNWYNTIFVDDTPTAIFTPGQLFTASMSEEECRHGLMLHSLMKHAVLRGTQLIVASSGPDKIRFELAIESHLDLLLGINLFSETRRRDYRCHWCGTTSHSH
ncbi:hypothetical protein DFH28DRAFT_1084533 [Melampsora americana]|nr:hypothetical protein DFH28DRAFT_1084533 [Melampsora americana]